MSQPDEAIPRPDPADADDAAFWAALRAGALRIQRCTACGASMDVKFVLPRCQECDERLWEREESSPYAAVS